MEDRLCCYRALYCALPDWEKAAPYLLLGGFIVYVFCKLVWATGSAFNIDGGMAIALTMAGIGAVALASWALIMISDYLCMLATRQ